MLVSCLTPNASLGIIDRDHLMGLALSVVVLRLGLVLGLVGAVLEGASHAIELVAEGAAVLGLLLGGLALGLLSVAGELVGGPVDVVLDGVDGGLDEAPTKSLLVSLL